MYIIFRAMLPVFLLNPLIFLINRPINSTTKDVILPGIYLIIGLFIMANCLIIVLYFIYGSSESSKIYKPKDATIEVRKIKMDIAADKAHEKHKRGGGLTNKKDAQDYYDEAKNYEIGLDDVMERWNYKYTDLFHNQKLKYFQVRLWFFIECGRIFTSCLLVSLVAKDVASQSVLIL